MSQPSSPSRSQRCKDSQGHPTRQLKPRHSPQSFVGSHRLEGPPIPARRPEDRPAEGTASCRETGQAHTCNLDPNGRGFMPLRLHLTIPSEDRHTLAKFMEGPWCGKAGAPWGSPHRAEGAGRRGLRVLGAGRASGSTVTTISAEVSGGGSLPASAPQEQHDWTVSPPPRQPRSSRPPPPLSPLMKQGASMSRQLHGNPRSQPPLPHRQQAAAMLRRQRLGDSLLSVCAFTGVTSAT